MICYMIRHACPSYIVDIIALKMTTLSKTKCLSDSDGAQIRTGEPLALSTCIILNVILSVVVVFNLCLNSLVDENHK